MSNKAPIGRKNSAENNEISPEMDRLGSAIAAILKENVTNLPESIKTRLAEARLRAINSKKKDDKEK